MRTLARALLAAVPLVFVFRTARAFETSDEEFVGLRFVKDSAGKSKTAGLGWHVRLEKDGCRLAKPLLVSSGRHMDLACDRGNSWAVPSALGGFADFGLVRPAGGGAPLEDVETDWTRATAVFGGGFRVTVSRLSPAVLVESAGKEIELFVGAAPRHFAVGGGKVVPPTGLGDVTKRDLSSGWVLCWFGKESPVKAPGRDPAWAQRGFKGDVRWDFPVLAVFKETLGKIRPSGAGGISFEFAGDGKLAVMPLMGEMPVLAAETGKTPVTFKRRFLPAGVAPTSEWATSVPEEVLARCRFWAERLADFPVGVSESCEYDAAQDRVTVSTRFKFTAVRRGGRRFAPVSPALALAQWGGLPVSFSKEPVGVKSTRAAPEGYVTPYGPYLGVEGADSYSYVIKGLGRYVSELRSFGPEAKAPLELRRRLEAEADKVLEAGIMAPWFPVVNACNQRGFGKDPQRLAYSNPGENLYFITQLMEVLGENYRERLKKLLAEWERTYPCLKVIHMPPTKGARRERYYAHLGDLQTFPNKHRNFHFSHKVVPVENMYYYWLARHYGAAGEELGEPPGELLEPYVRRTDWASGGSCRWDSLTYTKSGWGTTYRDKEYGWSGAADANRLFAGTVGYVRLAGMAGDQEQFQRGWYFLAKAAVLRIAMEKFKYYLYEKRVLAPPESQDALKYQYPWQLSTGLGVHTFNRKGPDDDPLVAAIWDEFGAMMIETETHFWWLTRLIPYLGMVPELGRFLHDHAAKEAGAYCAKVEESAPEWYTVMAECNWAGEQACMYPEDSYQIFLTRAWVMKQPPEALLRYADLSWLARGDWYYMHKLAETIKAYRGVKWE